MTTIELIKSPVDRYTVPQKNIKYNAAGMDVGGYIEVARGSVKVAANCMRNYARRHGKSWQFSIGDMAADTVKIYRVQ
jgi:hypothetical protein